MLPLSNLSLENYTNRIKDAVFPDDEEEYLIVGTCFFNENRIDLLNLETSVIVFYRCNMDNLVCPPQWILEECCNRFTAIIDEKLWETDKDGNPIACLEVVEDGE